MIKISVTMLEALRWSYIMDRDLDELIADLTYAKPKTAKMEAGAALAAFLEHQAASILPIDTATCQGWTFDFRGLEAELPAVPCTELKVRKLVTVSGGQVLLTGKADGVNALELRDQKLTEKFDPENYIESHQWKSYLWMLGAKRFVYDVFVGKLDEATRTVDVREYHPVPFYTYPLIEKDVLAAVDELACVIRRYRETRKALADAFPELPDKKESAR